MFYDNSEASNNMLSFLSCWTDLKPCSMNSTANIDQMYGILQSTAFRLDYFLPTKSSLKV